MFPCQAAPKSGYKKRGDCKQEAEHLLLCMLYSSCICMGGTRKQCFLRRAKNPSFADVQANRAGCGKQQFPKFPTVWQGAAQAQFLLYCSDLPRVPQVILQQWKSTHGGAVGHLLSAL